jgi:serine/threonine protein kinase
MADITASQNHLPSVCNAGATGHVYGNKSSAHETSDDHEPDRLEVLSMESCFKGKYCFLETLGSGGMGIIYKARQMMLNKLVAIKMVRRQLASPDAFMRFLFEGRASAMLTHPYIIRVHDFGTTDAGRPYLVMDFVDGKTLSELFTSEGRLSIGRFLQLFSQVCEAMSHAHDKGVLHRDIKPTNIMVVNNHLGQEEIRVMDFGIAKLIGNSDSPIESMTKFGTAIGSPLYMSPEQAHGSMVDARSDIYSLGCVMYEALSGNPPFRGKTNVLTLFKHLNENPAPISIMSVPADVESRITAMIFCMINKNPDLRYQSMADLDAEITAIIALLSAKTRALFAEPVGQRPVSLRRRWTHFFRWPRIWAGLLLFYQACAAWAAPV